MSRGRLLSSVDFVSVVVHTDRYVKKPSLCMAGTKHMSGAKGDQLRSCVKVEVDVMGSPSLIVLTVSVDVRQNRTELN